jgi:short-subunit dehydrogenase
MKEEQIININSEAPIKLTSALLPNILKSKTRKVAILTSQMGARNGGATPTGLYGKSKCYLNDNFRTIEPEWRSKGVTSILFHPGWVATDMGGANAPVSVEDSVKGMKSVIDKLTIQDSGKFYTWKGDIHPW